MIIGEFKIVVDIRFVLVYNNYEMEIWGAKGDHRN